MAIDYGGRKSKDEPPDLEELIEHLEGRVDRLKVLYEQYFMGIEKIEPQTARKEIERKLIELTQLNMRNTALRYRFNALKQRWGVYRTYWNRTLREIEKGTYIRNVSKVGREALRKGQDIPEEVLRSMPERMRERILKERGLVAERVVKAAARKGVVVPETSAPAEPRPPEPKPSPARPVEAQPVDEDDIDAMFDRIRQPTQKPKSIPPAVTARPPAPPPPPPPSASPPSGPTPKPKPKPKPKPELPPGMDDAKVQDLYKRYVQAKQLVGEDASRIKVENIVATISAQAPRIMAQHSAKAVEFSVVVKDNKVILKATPKK